MHARLTSLNLVAILTVCSALSGCSDPPPSKLFDEQGAWTVVQYELGDGLLDISTTRKDAFLLHFNAKDNVMTTAACGDEMSSFSPSESICGLSPSTTEWQCGCYSYAFQEDIMQMTEFAAGDVPPPVEFNPDLLPGQSGETGTAESGESGSGGGGESGGGGGGGLSVIRVSAIPELMDTYDFTPLPAGVFTGNGANNHFVVQVRSESLFNKVYDDPEGRPSCEPCVPLPAGG